MPNFGKERLEKTLKMVVGEIIGSELTNANAKLITVTAVELSKDRSHLKVFVTFGENAKKSMEALVASTGFIKSRIAQLEGLRKVPTLIFKEDNSFEKGLKIDRIIDQINLTNKKD